MVSLVYSRKWRPQCFGELAGQEHVVTTLRQAVIQSRVAHAYLFCGPRGTGKTTTARLLAKAANCLDLHEGDPCNACVACLGINEGRFLDIIELDAASNRGIDEIRNIRDRVNYAPAEGRRKVYIIDEAHMLTEQASNAFLKTLEEPPPHVVFIMCTTEPHKLLPTIISRCQRFDFRRLSLAVVVERLQKVCHEESVIVDEEALQALARYAGGSLRDAENLLEQLVVSYGSPVGLTAVEELLGLTRTDQALELVQCLLVGNSASALGAINRAVWDGADMRQLHRQTLELIRGVLVHQWGAGETLEMPQEMEAEVARLASRATTERVAKALRLFAQVDMRRDAPSPLPLELAVVETCLDRTAVANEAPVAQSVNSPTASTVKPPESSPIEKSIVNPARTVSPAPRSFSAPVEDSPAVTVRPPPPFPEPVSVNPAAMVGDPPSERLSDGLKFTGSSIDGWSELVKVLSRAKGRRFNIGALLRDCKSQRVEGDELVLTFAHRSHLERMQQEMEDPQSQRTVREALEKALDRAYGLRLTLSEDSEGGDAPSPAESHLVRFAMGMGARIVEEQEP